MPFILAVDDNRDILEVFTTILSMGGYEVSVADNEAAVWQELERQTPDAILMDVRLGFTDGRILCKQIKLNPRYRDTPVILISATPGKLQDFESCHADAVLEKPFDLSELRSTLENALVKSNV